MKFVTIEPTARLKAGGPDRRLYPGDRQPMYGIGLLRGMRATIKRMVMPVATIEFPEVTRPMSPRARTNLLWFDERCTGCSTCAQACPDGCILVETSPNSDGTLGSPQAIFSGRRLEDLVLADMNGDARLDLVSANLFAGCATVSPGLGDGCSP